MIAPLFELLAKNKTLSFLNPPPLSQNNLQLSNVLCVVVSLVVILLLFEYYTLILVCLPSQTH